MKITREIVLHTADLARLDLSGLEDGEMDHLVEQLDAIIGYVHQLDSLDTEGVDPTTHAVPQPIPQRPDQARPSQGRDRILSNAPHAEDGFFVVPRVIAE